MKTLIFGILLLVTLPASAGDALFNWVKPDPAFTFEPPPGWIINEYRIYCSVAETGGTWAATVPGYDSENYQALDLVVGTHSCYIVSYSASCDCESDPSQTVTKQIFSDQGPNAPAGFDFNQSFRAVITPVPQ